VPGHEAGVTGFLDEEAGVPAQDVRAQQVLHRVEDFRMADHLVDPAEEYVAAMTHLALDRAAAQNFVVFQLAAEVGDFGCAQGIDRKMVTAVLIGRDFLVAQEFRHGRPPVLLLLRLQQSLERPCRWGPALSRS
jgi:hypothetical protein